MSLLINDIRNLQVGDILLRQDPDMGWSKTEIRFVGLNYMTLKTLEGRGRDQLENVDLDKLMQPNAYHIYIIPPSTKGKRSWFVRWLRKVLIQIIEKLD